MLNFLNLKSLVSHLFFWVASSLSILCVLQNCCFLDGDFSGQFVTSFICLRSNDQWTSAVFRIRLHDFSQLGFLQVLRFISKHFFLGLDWRTFCSRISSAACETFLTSSTVYTNLLTSALWLIHKTWDLFFLSQAQTLILNLHFPLICWFSYHKLL